MLCLNNVKSAAYKPRGYYRHPSACIFTHVAGCQPSVLKGWTPYPSWEIEPWTSGSQQFAAHNCTCCYLQVKIIHSFIKHYLQK